MRPRVWPLFLVWLGTFVVIALSTASVVFLEIITRGREAAFQSINVLLLCGVVAAAILAAVALVGAILSGTPVVSRLRVGQGPARLAVAGAGGGGHVGSRRGTH